MESARRWVKEVSRGHITEALPGQDMDFRHYWKCIGKSLEEMAWSSICKRRGF